MYGWRLSNMGRPAAATVENLTRRLDPLFSSPSDAVNRELCQLLVYLDSLNVVPRAMKLLAAALTQEEQVHYVVTLRSEAWLDARAGELKALEPVLKGSQTEVTLKETKPRQFVHNWQMEE